MDQGACDGEEEVEGDWEREPGLEEAHNQL